MQPGEYEVGIYVSEAKNSGKKYLSGKIREPFKREDNVASGKAIVEEDDFYAGIFQ